MGQLNVVTIHNPLDPSNSTIERMNVSTPRSMAELFPSVAVSRPMAYTHNGQVIEREQMASVFPVADDWVTVSPVPGDGDNGKAILRIVAMIAISYFTFGAGGMGAGSFLGMTGAAGWAAAGAAFVGGAMLVNTLLPPPKPPVMEERNDSATYGIDGAKNTSAEGVPTPLIYGKFRYGGNIIANHVVNSGATQYLYMLINCGEGPIASITDVEINDQPIANYTEAEYDPTKLGEPDQTPMAWFPDTITPQSVNIKVSETYTIRTTTAAVDRVRLDFAATLFTVTEEGDYINRDVHLVLEYRKVGTTTWLPLPISEELSGYEEFLEYYPVTYVRYVGESQIEEWITAPYTPTGTETRVGDQVVDSTGKVVGYYWKKALQVLPGVVKLENSSRSTYRRSVGSAQLPESAQYEIRVKRTNAEQNGDQNFDITFWTDLNEIVNDAVGYRNTALLGIKIKLSDQLNGLPTVTHLNGGKRVKVFKDVPDPDEQWPLEPSSNPAWISLDILTNSRYGGGSSLSRIDLTRWKEWAKFCDDEGLEFNGVFDTQSNVWDAVTTVMRAGHAQIVPVGTRYSVAIERDEVPVQMFSVANMIAGTFRETWLPMVDRANEIEFTFNDRLDKYKSRTIRVADSSAAALGTMPRSAKLSMHGVVDAQRAFEEAMLILRMNRYIRRTIEFGAMMDAVACSNGSIILVQHDMPKWGMGGRLEAGCTTNQLVLDRPILMETAKTYQAMVHYDAIQRFSGTITSVTGRSILLGSFTGATNVKRLKVGTKDVEVESVYQSGPNYGVIVKDATGITGGSAYTLWDTNVLETRNVLLDVGEPTTITLQTPLPSAPAQFSKWLFGETNKVVKPFRVKSIQATTEYRRDIVATEHNATIYDISGSVAELNYSTLQPLSSGVALPAVIDQVYEFQARVASTVQTKVTVTFRSSQPAYLISDVFVQRNGGQFVFAGSGQSEVTVDAADGDSLVFRVFAKDRFGRTAKSVDSTPFTVIGKAAPPKNVSGFGPTYEPFGVRLTWNAVPDLDLDSYEIRYGANWESGQLLDRVKSLEYFWKLQTATSITVWIKARDTSGNYSAAATSTTVQVLAPQAPVVSHQIAGATDELLSWNIPISMAAIDRYEIRYGASFGSGTFLDSTKANSYRRKVDYVGGRTYWVAAIDAAGNVGVAGSVSPTINAPGPVQDQRAEVIDNNVLFFWTPPTFGTLAVDRYEMRKGATWDGGTPIGSNGNSTFGTVFEQASGTYTYWIAAYDTAGNIGTPVAITATVNQPPDYVLRNNIDSTLSSEEKTNVIADNGALIGPVNTTQDWATHFTANAWNSPQQQVDAGLPIYIQPGVTSGSYAETYDLGAIIPTTMVTVTAAKTVVAGTEPALTCQLYYKKLDQLSGTTGWNNGSATVNGSSTSFSTQLVPGDVIVAPNGSSVTVQSITNDTTLVLTAPYGGATISGQTTLLPWIAGTPGFNSLVSNARFLRIVLTITAAVPGPSILAITSLNIKLANKLKTDSGTFTITNATAGVFVPFGVAFIDADLPICQAAGSTPLTPVVDFSDTPNPTGFTVYLYNAGGSRVTGSGSWTARGY